MKNIQNERSVWEADLENGQYKNPVLHADYSDPDVVRVGDDYYMVSSSFNMSPCLPVLHSKDLVNWTIINHVAKELPFDHYDEVRHGEGVWAPSIRYHDGKFWVFFATPDEGIFMSTANDPAKDWTPLHLVKEVKGWIDPCPFWDEDGQAYLVNAFAKSRIGFKSILHMSRMSPDGKELLDEGIHIFDGNAHHETIEGPKMYKRNGYYYIFAPAGGVATGWQTILRSKEVFGPYEDKIVLHQGDTNVNGPHQGGWVDDAAGESWFVHFQDKGAYGRIVHLQPMSWENDWPVMGTNQNEDEIGEPVMQWEKPVCKESAPLAVPATSDEFSGDTLGLQWQWRANMKEHWSSLKHDGLRLFAIEQSENVKKVLDTPHVLTQKFPAEEFYVTTKVRAEFEDEHARSGLVVLGQQYAGISIKKTTAGLAIVSLMGGMEQEEEEVLIDTIPNQELYLQLHVEPNAVCTFSYSLDGVHYENTKLVFTAVEGRWIGAQFGIYCLNKAGRTSNSFADFSYVNIHM